MKAVVLQPEFVECVPEDLEDGKLYISETYRTAVHKCCCGCGQKVVTPLSPTGWKLTVDGKCVSLYPSIGNWSFPCQSHYWIRRNAVQWSYQMTQREIEAGRRYDAKAKERYFAKGEVPSDSYELSEPVESGAETPKEGFWQMVMRWMFG